MNVEPASKKCQEWLSFKSLEGDSMDKDVPVRDVWAWIILAVTVGYAVTMVVLPVAVILPWLVVLGGVGFLLGVGCLWAVGVLSGSV